MNKDEFKLTPEDIEECEKDIDRMLSDRPKYEFHLSDFIGKPNNAVFSFKSGVVRRLGELEE